ncbi:GGDEF domain-containing protein [Vreelandella titanicae]|uniref:diguanylate cyclase n=1 Tax=Vreelandella titanicae TaxID=664683 RepID=A0A558J9D9_9GAMM|nr:sensor domain-containing diguanylate cyclase [Halomonas titanicae]TVU90204.1 diguanylate cyclase [Halomonas titanicae]
MISPRPRFPLSAPGPKKGSLTTKQALLTLLIAMLISGVAGSIELLSHATKMRQETEQRITQQLTIVNGAAAEAAFQLNPDLAHQIAYGLFNDNEVAWVSIRDDFGRALAEFDRPEQAGSTWLSQYLFGDILHYRTSLAYYMGSDMPEAVVGEIELMLAEGYLTQQFLARIYTVVGVSILEAFILSLVIITFFHLFITRPLLKVHAAIAQTDPTQPGKWSKPVLKGHQHDELGHLVDSLDHLLKAFQQGLEQRDQLHHLSNMDGLTGVANRRQFDDFYQRHWHLAQQTQQSLSVIFIDIDNFKEFNDHYGHAMGDDTLRAVANALNQCIDPAKDLLARYGGEEFVCVLPGQDHDDAVSVANCLREAVLSLAIPHAFSSTHSDLTVSMGVASMSPGFLISAEALIERADQHLYRAKRLGRNRVETRKRPA